MLNFLKKDATVKYKSVNNIVKAHYEEFLANKGINDSIKRAGISFPMPLYEFLKVFSKYEGLTVSKLVVDVLLYILEDKERFDKFLKEKYGKKLS